MKASKRQWLRHWRRVHKSAHSGAQLETIGKKGAEFQVIFGAAKGTYRAGNKVDQGNTAEAGDSGAAD